MCCLVKCLSFTSKEKKADGQQGATVSRTRSINKISTFTLNCGEFKCQIRGKRGCGVLHVPQAL